MSRKLFLSLLIIYLFSANKSFASAWNVPDGQLSIINSFFYNKITSFFDKGGKKKAQPTFSKFEYKPYIEYGYSNEITLGLSPSMQAIEAKAIFGNSVDSNYGLVFTELFLRKNIFKFGNQVSSFEVGAEIPGFYSTRESPEFGKKDFFVNSKISYGYGGDFYFFNIDSGIRMRPYDNLDFSDVRAGVQSISSASLGFDYKDSIQVILGMNYTKSLSDFTNFTNTARYGFDVLRSEFQLVKFFGSNSISFSAIQDMEGKNVGKSEIGVISITKRF